MAEKELSTAELLAASIDSLTTDQLMRRSAIISMQKNEREMELANYENEKFQTAKEERLRMRQVAIQNSIAEQAKIEAEQMSCAHKTGGEGLAGWFAGDGALYGSCTAALQLPTGEIYYLCFRCQKEWHRPSKRKVMNGEMTMDEYRYRDQQYQEVSRWPRKSFAPLKGEICAASLFRLPALEAQIAQDDRDFNIFLNNRRKQH